VRAMCMAPCESFHLLTAGSIEDDAVLSHLKSLGERWHHAGWVNDVTPTLAVADMLCLPTLREGFPNVVLEASAAKLPVVTTSVTGARDSVVQAVTGFLVPPRDPAALAESLGVLGSDPALRRQLGEAGFQRASNDFSREEIWNLLNETYGGRSW